ncbi:MAG: hypothetical protein A3J24_00080 [Deltaproteobacteria bacterium RIFCSPLOWO2_02_FULL_53_8]|nr:MAG: hypothetical protein A3J24_00080 [Deltaproteobacteria bacterium RIFCSPLOWO2_02_FULL_53_8]
MSWIYYIRMTAACAVFFVLTGCAAADKKEASPLQVKGSEMRAAGVVAYGSGDYARAQTLLVEALRLDRSVDNRKGELIDLINLARLSLVMDDGAGAQAWLADAISLATVAKDDAGLSQVYATLARADYISGRPDDELKHIGAALAIDASTGVKSGANLNLKAEALIASGMYEQASAVLKDALKINLDAGDVLETSNTYRAMAEAGLAQGSDAAALDYYKKAYEVSRESGNSARLVRDLTAISAIEIKTGRNVEALFSLKRLYAVASASGMMKEAAYALDRLVSLNEAAGSAEQADFYRNLKADLLQAKTGEKKEDGGR